MLLGKQLGLPVVHLDALYWQPGWVASSPSEMEQQVEAACQQETWVIDGNYSASMNVRLQHADLVILLDYARWTCLKRVVIRSVRDFGRVRPDSAPGCPERLDPRFLLWVWRWFGERRRSMLELVESAGAWTDVRILQDDASVSQLLKSLE